MFDFDWINFAETHCVGIDVIGEDLSGNLPSLSLSYYRRSLRSADFELRAISNADEKARKRYR